GRHGHSRTVEPHRPPQVDDGLCHGGGCVTWVAAGAPGARLPPGRLVCLLAIAPLVAPACRAAQLPAALLAFVTGQVSGDRQGAALGRWRRSQDPALAARGPRASMAPAHVRDARACSAPVRPPPACSRPLLVPAGREAPPRTEVPDRGARAQATVARVLPCLGATGRHRLSVPPRGRAPVAPLAQRVPVAACALPRATAVPPRLGGRPGSPGPLP